MSEEESDMRSLYDGNYTEKKTIQKQHSSFQNDKNILQDFPPLPSDIEIIENIVPNIEISDESWDEVFDEHRHRNVFQSGSNSSDDSDYRYVSSRGSSDSRYTSSDFCCCNCCSESSSYDETSYESSYTTSSISTLGSSISSGSDWDTESDSTKQ